MDEHTHSPEPQPGRRTFILTPAPPSGDRRARQATKSRRTLIIGGALTIPFVTSIPGEPALAYKTNTKTKKTKTKYVSGGISYHPSITGKKKKTKKKKFKKWGDAGHGGETVAMWQQKYPQLLQNGGVEAHVFPAKATTHRYLANPMLASVFVVPREAVNGVAISPPDGNLNGALNGRGGWTVSLTHNGETVHQRMDGAFFAEATAALLNGAVRGENGFGMTDRMVIDQVNSALRNLQGRALALRQSHPTWETARILDGVARHITGGNALDPRGETYYLAQLNSGGMA